MAPDRFYVTALRLSLITADEAREAGILLSARERPIFDRDPLAFYLADAGPTRRKQLLTLAQQGVVEVA